MIGRHEAENLILVPQSKAASHEESIGEKMMVFSIEIAYAATVTLSSFIEEFLYVKSIITSWELEIY